MMMSAALVVAPSDGSAWESPAGLARVVRGGTWFFNAGRARRAGMSAGRLRPCVRPGALRGHVQEIIQCIAQDGR